MKIWSAVIVFLCAYNISELAYAENGVYSLEELQALVASETWYEAQQHLNDISPLKRDAVWQELVTKTAVGSIQKILSSSLGDQYSSYVIAEDLNQKYSFLIKSDKWVELLRLTGRRYFGRMLKSTMLSDPEESILLSYLTFVVSFPKDLELAQEAVGIITSISSGGGAAPFIKHFVEISTDKEAACSDKSVWPALKQSLNLAPESENAQTAKKLVLGDCWTALSASVLDEISTGTAGSNFAKNLCDDLKNKGKLGHFQTKACEK